MLGSGSGCDQSAEKSRVRGGTKPRITLLATENERLGVDSPAAHPVEAANGCRTGIPGQRELALHRDAAPEPVLPRPNLDHQLAAICEPHPENA
jgi:hypothetical protein